MTIYKEALDRINTQREKVLHLLKQRGSNGVFNYELAKIALSYQRRIHDLIEEGYDVVISNEGGGAFKYTLKNLSPSKTSKRSALEMVIREIEENYGGSIDALELLDIIENLGVNVCHKGMPKVRKKETA
ncbi:hypothetical protein MOD67_14305 [Bacillus licheniformis]|uniref:hypothetical protein n=1 Tax=Bacillus TaxID=1386 RepID=UPI002282E911|nr:MULTISPECIES: hypothetical protein [Bacillus]MCY7861196.1 hypothetical protein [Bacillus haynesii]MCY8015476.1 hypothetical protein [Bacillus haynesii]MCY8291475.1 hypothetical protein [Bacillus haynesii]MCY8549098.1 hypothetical protein [Bacillus haynesii]MCY8745153.1 hypothetical protein [Bacillus licheniformis]